MKRNRVLRRGLAFPGAWYRSCRGNLYETIGWLQDGLHRAAAWKIRKGETMNDKQNELANAIESKCRESGLSDKEIAEVCSTRAARYQAEANAADEADEGRAQAKEDVAGDCVA
jgi:hypothetical protein